MNTLSDQIDLRTIFDRARVVLDEPTGVTQRNAEPSESLEVRPGCNERAVTLHPEITWRRFLACNADSSNLVKFPFALSAYVTLVIGQITFCFGCAAAAVGLAAPGAVLISAGALAYGSSHDD